MNTVRLALAGALMLGLTGAIQADKEKGGKPDIQKKLIGKWEIIKFAGGSPAIATLEFTKDGKIVATMKENGGKSGWEATYKVEGKQVTITRKRGDREMTQRLDVVKVDAKELVVRSETGEKELTLKRKEP